MFKVILLLGRKGVGKNFVASQLESHFIGGQEDILVTPLAYPIKRAVRQMFSLTHAQTDIPKYKEVELDYWGMTPRKIMQLFGTEAMQPTFGKEVWCKILHKRMEDLSEGPIRTIFIVDDCRFDHEVEFAIKTWDPFFIEIANRTVPNSGDTHASEKGISDGIRHLMIHNSKYFPIDNSNRGSFYFPHELASALSNWLSS